MSLVYSIQQNYIENETNKNNLSGYARQHGIQTVAMKGDQIVRLAKLVIDSAQLDTYKILLEKVLGRAVR